MLFVLRILVALGKTYDIFTLLKHVVILFKLHSKPTQDKSRFVKIEPLLEHDYVLLAQTLTSKRLPTISVVYIRTVFDEPCHVFTNLRKCAERCFSQSTLSCMYKVGSKPHTLLVQ